MSITSQHLGKHVTAETNSRNNRRAVFSAWFVPRGYKKDKEDRLRQRRVRIPPVSRRRRRKMELNAWGYNWATLFLGG
jgi:hypothetical protein